MEGRLALSLLLLVACFASLAYAELKMVYHFHRHGARGPIFNVTDISKWDQMEQLTPVGMRQLYLLGAEYRRKERYGNFLPQSYDANAIYVRSTFFNRTISSALSYLYGLFPPGMGQALDEKLEQIAVPPLLYQFDVKSLGLGTNALPNRHLPIPIHISKKENEFIPRAFDVCPMVPKYQAEAMESQIYKEIDEGFKDLYPQIARALNMDENKVDLVMAHRIMDNLLVDYYDNRNPIIPYDSDLWKRLLGLFNVTVMAFKYPTKDKVNLYTTKLNQDVLKLFNRAVNDPKNQLKWAAFAVHDTTINLILTQLGITSWECIFKKYKENNFDFDPKCTNPAQIASSLVFELHKEGNKNFVRIFYEDNQYGIGDAKDIDYQTFENTLKQGIVDNFDDLCFGTVATEIKKRGSIPVWKVLALALLIFITISLATLLVVNCLKMRNLQNDGYARI